ncbi:MAG TPA: hypothetical protein VFE46_06030 [Pirellulales bacterium]|nr:hypothetical protein [Pirellulales bacterium]
MRNPLANCLAALVVTGALCSNALALDYYSTSAAQQSSPQTFRLLDQPAMPPVDAVPLPGALPSPIAAPPPFTSPAPVAVAQLPAPNPTWATSTPATNYVPPTSDCPTEPLPGCPSIATWYTRIDYFHWNERIDGADFVNESGPLFTLGYERRVNRERFRAEFFGSQVQSSSEIDLGGGILDPLHAHTNYLGLRAEYELLFEPQTLPELDFFLGLGTRFWIRDLPDAFTDGGLFVMGYQETWWTIYPYFGMETRQLPQPDLQWYGRGRIGLTAVTYQNLNVDPAVTLYPLPGIEAQAEGGLRGQRLFVGAYFEALSWSQSAVVRGWYQPTSRMFTVGVKTGVSF